MKFTYIHSSELPSIDESIKACVNSGEWFLFKANQSDEGVFYFLKVGHELFSLNQTGEFLASSSLSKNIEMDEFFYFDDLPKPVSLSNQYVTAC